MYPTYGHALWDSTPTRPDMPVKIGDVGFIRWGKFHRFFNALLPANDPSHELGVPENHEPLALNYHGPVNADDFQHVSFACPGRRKGAVLCLLVKARLEDTLAQGDFGKWILRNIDHWFAFTRRLGLGIERMEQIILVTGCDRMRSWTNWEARLMRVHR
ncbi:hypothetical protein BC827DRAFT_1156210 [Russula dissimulans]|nr:hypothetical protein BC827DRAFT_1156210 [Russula dissimulans]